MSVRLLLSASGLRVSFADNCLFTIDNLELFAGDRVALVGENGSGKTTLLRLLAGEAYPSGVSGEDGIAEPLVPDAGTIRRAGDVACVRQDVYANADTPWRSGGEIMRSSLARAFSQNAAMLFADEPSTHLDADGRNDLIRMFSRCKSAFVLVSHDRELLDAVCTMVWSLEGGTLRTFPGTYSEWRAQRSLERESAEASYERYRAEKKRIETAARRTREEARSMTRHPGRMSSSEWRLYKDIAARQQKNVQSRASALEKRASKLSEQAPPPRLPDVSFLSDDTDMEQIVSATAVRVSGCTVKYGGRTVIDRADFVLPSRARTVMLGRNGAGKTTLARHILSGDSSVTLAPGLRAGYYAQDLGILDDDETVIENLRRDSRLGETGLRTLLACLRFPGDLVFKKAGVLSGGERAKAALAKLVSGYCNMLVLDEPTQFLDLYAAEALEELLLAWPGTLLLITHDTELARKTADRLLFVEDGTVRTFEGCLAEYEGSC